MKQTILTSFDENEFKELLKEILIEVLQKQLHKKSDPLEVPMNIQEAAEFLKLKVTTLYDKTSRRLIPHSKIGNKLYFKLGELKNWIENGKVKTQEEIEGMATTHVLTKKN